jgi:hypothetical protein
MGRDGSMHQDAHRVMSASPPKNGHAPRRNQCLRSATSRHFPIDWARTFNTDCVRRCPLLENSLPAPLAWQAPTPLA